MRLSHVFLLARDLDRLVAFYRDTLGLPVVFEEPGACAFLDLGGPRLALYPGRTDLPHPADRPAPWLLVLDVDDVAARAAELRERGVEVEPIRAVPFGKAADLVDPEGNRLELHEPDRPDAPA